MNYQAYFTMAQAHNVPFATAFQMLANLMEVMSDWEQKLLLEQVQEFKYEIVEVITAEQALEYLRY